MTDREYLEKWMPRIEAAIFHAYRAGASDGGLMRRQMNLDAAACEAVLLEIRKEALEAIEKVKLAVNGTPATKPPAAPAQQGVKTNGQNATNQPASNNQPRTPAGRPA